MVLNNIKCTFERALQQLVSQAGFHFFLSCFFEMGNNLLEIRNAQRNCKYCGKSINTNKDVLIFLKAVSGGYCDILSCFDQS